MTTIRQEDNNVFIGGDKFCLSDTTSKVLYKGKYRQIWTDKWGRAYVLHYENKRPVKTNLDLAENALNYAAMEELFEAAWQALQALDGISKLHPKMIASDKTIPALKAALKKAKP